MKLRHRIVVAFAGLLFVAFRPEAASLKVAPARFIVHNVAPGKLYDIYRETGLRLTIFNDDDVSRTWLVSAYRPSERGSWEKGYAEIPDAKWCWFDNNEVTVEPNGKAYAQLFLNVPEDEKYFNQHWVVTLGVDGKPGRGGIALAADVRVQIETKSKADVAGPPDGPLGVVPASLRFEDIVPGQAADVKATIFNNSAVVHDYDLLPLFSLPDIERATYLTQSYEAVPDAKWLTYESRVHIEPGRSADLAVHVTIPGDAAFLGKKWEELLLIQPDNAPAGFVRVQILTKEKSKTE